MRVRAESACLAAALAVSFVANGAQTAQPASLGDALAVIQSHRFVDLTHTFAPAFHIGRVRRMKSVKTLYTVKKDGFRINEYCHIGQWGSVNGVPTSTLRRISTKDCSASIKSIRRTC